MLLGSTMALSGLAHLSPKATPAPCRIDAAPFDEAAAKALANRASAGIQLSIWREGQSCLSKAYGIANLETMSPVSSASVFRVGSLTKQFTAAAIVKLAALGRLKLDDAATVYLPAFKKSQRFTLLELMHHTAGLHSDESETAPPSLAGANPRQMPLIEAIAAQETLFDFAPGTAWRYSNANYIALGAIVEVIHGKPLAEALAELLFRPLNLRRTAVDQVEEVLPGRVSGYSSGDAGGETFINAPFLNIVEAGGAGAVRSTTDDLCQWHTALLSNRLFPAQWLDRMLLPGRLRDGRLSGANRFLAEDAHYGDVQYAGGLLVSPPDRVTRITHYGYINGFSAVLETDRERHTTFAVCCNGDPGPALPFRDIRRLVNALPR
jgi:CubicO group peptidase (beta-lactamase class C family)